MAWNEPGGGRDPWGGRGDQQGPPDLEEAIKNLQAKVSRIFGGGKSTGGRGGGHLGSMGIGIIIVILLGLWAVFGFYIVEPAEEGVVTRFGQYVRTTEPGLHWRPLLIEDREIVNVKQVNREEIGFRSAGRSEGSVPREALMLTQDENIVDLRFEIQYRVNDSKAFLFNVVEPIVTLRQVTESAIREIVGQNRLEYVFTEGRSAVAAAAEEAIQTILDRYQVGIGITNVNMLGAQPPPEVQDAFSDVVKAREDKVRLKNEAEAYANDITPKARGDAAAMREQAEAYKQRVIAAAEGETNRFLSVLGEYKKAPEVTRKRLYIESLESVLGNSSKVLVDVEGGNNLLYVPLDKLLSGQGAGASTGFMGGGDEAGVSGAADQSSRRPRESLRGRTR